MANKNIMPPTKERKADTTKTGMTFPSTLLVRKNTKETYIPCG